MVFVSSPEKRHLPGSVLILILTVSVHRILQNLLAKQPDLLTGGLVRPSGT